MTGRGPEGTVDPEAAVAEFIARLEQSRSGTLPNGPVPPADVAALGPARSEARAAAERAGVGEALSRAQMTIAEWALKLYQREGFAAAYLAGWQDTPERRLEVADLMVDAATAVALGDLLSDDTRAVLTARFDKLDGVTTDG
jgi:hypothetical protein